MFDIIISNGIIIDGGIGTIKQDAITLTHEKNSRTIRLDISAVYLEL